MTRPSCLLTGGAGFIGSHLAEALLERGHEVHVLDDLSTGSMRNIRHLKDRPGFGYTIADIADEPLLAERIDEADVVFHLAAAVGVRLIVEKPVHTIEINITGTERVLRLAAKKGRRVFVFSTSEVYGKSADLPFREDGDLVLGPTTKGRWAYACSKAVDEFLALSYHKEHRLPTTVLRLFNTVGPRQVGRYGMVIPRLIGQALDGAPLTVYGDGRQTRCFADVSDVVAAILGLLGCADAAGQVYNIGNDQEIAIDDLAARIIARSGSGSKIVHVPYDQAYESGFEDMRRRVPDLAKIRRAIGWQPKKDIDAILDGMIAYERTHRQSASARLETIE